MAMVFNGVGRDQQGPGGGRRGDPWEGAPGPRPGRDPSALMFFPLPAASAGRM